LNWIKYILNIILEKSSYSDLNILKISKMNASINKHKIKYVLPKISNKGVKKFKNRLTGKGTQIY